MRKKRYAISANLNSSKGKLFKLSSVLAAKSQFISIAMPLTSLKIKINFSNVTNAKSGHLKIKVKKR